MNECGCNEHAGAKVTREEEEVVRYGKTRESADDDGKGASCRANGSESASVQAGGCSCSARGSFFSLTSGTQHQDQHQRKDVQRRVVLALARSSAGGALRVGNLLLHHAAMSACELSLEQGGGDVGP